MPFIESAYSVTQTSVVLTLKDATCMPAAASLYTPYHQIMFEAECG